MTDRGLIRIGDKATLCGLKATVVGFKDGVVTYEVEIPVRNHPQLFMNQTTVEGSEKT
jgi:hypothetical protein